MAAKLAYHEHVDHSTDFSTLFLPINNGNYLGNQQRRVRDLAQSCRWGARRSKEGGKKEKKKEREKKTVRAWTATSVAPYSGGHRGVHILRLKTVPQADCQPWPSLSSPAPPPAVAGPRPSTGCAMLAACNQCHVTAFPRLPERPRHAMALALTLRRLAITNATPRTALYDFHVKHGYASYLRRFWGVCGLNAQAFR